MQQRKLGPDGPLVGAIGLGTNLLASFPHRPSLTEAGRLLARAAETGITLWDAADVYCIDDTDIGYSEWMCEQAVKTLPSGLSEQVVIATKGGIVRPEGGWERDASPEHLREAIDASLIALKTDSIALWQLHVPDEKVPFADSMGALAEARQQGKIRCVGLSNVTPAQIDEAMGIVPLTSIQNSYSPANRSAEHDGTLEKCRELGLAFLSHTPLGGVRGSKNWGENGALAQIAEELEASPQRVVLAWQLQKYDRMILIPGVSRIETIEDSAKADQVELTPQHMVRLDEAFQS